MSRNYRKEYDNFQGKPDQIANRSKRNSARRRKQQELGYKLNSKQHVHHKNGNPQDNNSSNLVIRSQSANTSDNKQGKKSKK